METGLDYFGARYLSSAQGRFISADPLLSSGHPLNPQTWNRYSYVLNNPLKFVDPDGEELRLATGLSDKDKHRIIRNLAKAYRTDVGRAALKQLEGSPMVHTYGTKTLPSQIVTIGNQQYLLSNPGRTEPQLVGTMDAKRNAVTVDKSKSTVNVSFDFPQIDKNQGDFAAGRISQPMSEDHVTFHEIGHDLDVDTDPVREYNQSRNQAEANAEGFAGSVESGQKTMSQKQAEKELLKIFK